MNPGMVYEDNLALNNNTYVKSRKRTSSYGRRSPLFHCVVEQNCLVERNCDIPPCSHHQYQENLYETTEASFDHSLEESSSFIYEISPSNSRSSSDILDDFLESYEKRHLQKMCQGLHGSVRMYNSMKLSKKEMETYLVSSEDEDNLINQNIEQEKCDYTPLKDVGTLKTFFDNYNSPSSISKTNDVPVVRNSVAAMIDMFENLNETQKSTIDEVDQPSLFSRFTKANVYRSMRYPNPRTPTTSNFVRTKSNRHNRPRLNFWK